MQVYASLHPFFPQLRSLGIHNNRMLRGPPVWKHVISCAAPALQYFTTHYHLTDELLGLLLKHAPGIKQLGIGGLGLQESHRDKTWKVENLNIDQAWDSPEVGQLALLPAREEGAGKVEVRTGELPPARDMGLGKLCVRSRESWISRIRDTEVRPVWRVCVRVCVCVARGYGGDCMPSKDAIHASDAAHDRDCTELAQVTC